MALNGMPLDRKRPPVPRPEDSTVRATINPVLNRVGGRWVKSKTDELGLNLQSVAAQHRLELTTYERVEMSHRHKYASFFVAAKYTNITSLACANQSLSPLPLRQTHYHKGREALRNAFGGYYA